MASVSLEDVDPERMLVGVDIMSNIDGLSLLGDF